MKSCLIVDDSPTVRKITARIVSKLGFTTREAGDGVDACDACTTSMPDLILLDWNMPRMDGLSFLRHLRQQSGGDKPQVIFCTSEDDFNHITAALDAGADEYIMKPFDDVILQTKIALTGL